MVFAGEQQLTAPKNWLYFFVTTATTVGYGDLIPSSQFGRMVAAVFMLPVSVMLFAGFLGKCSSTVIGLWRRQMLGQADYSEMQGHLVVLGWHPTKTPRMLQLLFAETHDFHNNVILCAVDDMANPNPDRVKFIKGESLSSEEVLYRASVEKAARIIVHHKNDDQTLVTCLAVCSTGTQAHIVAWFESSDVAELVRLHCPQVECQTSLAPDLIVCAAHDPGSSRLQSQLLSPLTGSTQFSMQIPSDFMGTTFGKLFAFMKLEYDAMVLGIANSATGCDLHLNPPNEYAVLAGQLIYYMASKRIHAKKVGWAQIKNRDAIIL